MSMRKKQFLAALAVLSALWLLGACSLEGEVPIPRLPSGGGNGSAVTGVSLNKTSAGFTVGGVETLIATVSPSNAANKNVTWSSNAPTIATVSSNGTIIAVSAGTTNITVTTADGGRTATCAVSVAISVTSQIKSSELAARLASLSANTTATPHTIPIIVSVDSNNEYAVDGQFYEIKEALRGAPNKCVFLDFSGSNMPFIPYRAFSSEVNDVFTGCNTLIGVNIPNTVNEISYDAFRSCENLASIDIPNSVTTLNNSSFVDCKGLASVTLPNRITNIQFEVFRGCTSLASINIPNAVTNISYYAFQDCTSLASITIPSSVTKIEGGAFERCKSLTSVIIPNSVTKIESLVFAGTGLTSITIPDSITEMDGWVFVNCEKLVNISIGKGLTKIDEGAFGWCYSYSSITIPANIKRIEKEAFAGGNLTSVTFQGTISASDFHTDAFKDQGSDLREKYLAGGIGTYTRANGEAETWTKQ